jgi:hypothetical protein
MVMPFTNEEAKSIEFMVESYTLSKETFTFSEENDILWNKLFNDSLNQKKHEYSTFDMGNLIMTVIKKNIFFVKTNDQFENMLENDKMALLQKNMSEICHLRGAIRFDTKSKNFVWYFAKKDQLQLKFKNDDGSNTGRNYDSDSNGKSTSLRNAVIGPKDMSNFYKNTTSHKIFEILNKLCERNLLQTIHHKIIILIKVCLWKCFCS